MRDIQLLDCTLRDGGYVNDWEFGHNNLISIYERLVDAGVDMIEVGFLDDRRPYDWNRSIFPNTESVDRIWASTRKRPTMVVAMIDYGTCDIANLQPADETMVDVIRVIFKKHLRQEAIEYCRQVKALGYKVCAQLVSVTTYTEEELADLIALVNDVEPYAVSMVDTYGLLNPRELRRIYKQLDNGVKPGIRIGFHAHNNFQLAYANCIAFLEYESKHDLLVDGTLYGMGKSAGNAPLELLIMELNNHYEKHYDVHPVLEAIEESIMDFYQKSPWGYKMFFYLSAENGVHPSYVSDYQQKRNLSLSDMDAVLGEIQPQEKKLLYDRSVSEKTYENYRQSELVAVEDTEKLRNELTGQDILLIGPGKNIKLQADKVEQYIKNHHPLTISINYLPDDYAMNYVFVTNRKRYQQMTDALHEQKNAAVRIIETSNVTAIQDNHPVYRVERAPLLELKEHITDNSLLMLLKTLQNLGIRKVSLAGFDGYSDKDTNYFNPSMEYSFVRDEAHRLNRQIRRVMEGSLSDMELNFITYSHYTDADDSFDAAF
jgi:4-hydroxy 2-oxovalerate aldolase